MKIDMKAIVENSKAIYAIILKKKQVPFAELEKMVQTGDMLDGKTIAALYKTKLLLKL